MEPGEGQDSQEAVEDRLQRIVSLLFAGDGKATTPALKEASAPATKEDMEVSENGTCRYTTWWLCGRVAFRISDIELS